MYRMIGFAIIGFMSFSRAPEAAPEHPAVIVTRNYSICIILYSWQKILNIDVSHDMFLCRSNFGPQLMPKKPVQGIQNWLEWFEVSKNNWNILFTKYVVLVYSCKINMEMSQMAFG